MTYIDTNPFDEGTAERVAKLLEAAADKADLEADKLEKVGEELAKFNGEIEAGIDAYQDEVDAAQDKYTDEIISAVDEATVKLGEIGKTAEPTAPPQSDQPLSQAAAQQQISQQPDSLSAFSAIPQPQPVQMAQPVQTVQPVQEIPVVAQPPQTQPTTY